MMRRFLLTLGIFVFSFFLLPTNNNYAFAEKISNDDEFFIDLDGDGFNDSVTDIDNTDPDDIDSKTELNQNSDDLISLDFNLDSETAAPLYNAEKFVLLKFSARGLQSNRGESDAGFGGNSGGVGGSSQSGGCAGGACVAN
ncbi:MAG: hypothetical protein GY865_17295 [candidate division Zixibacteria bacterium]|nr:hypothetical protein [candidate division Zixibacteria bacterium]